LPAVGSIVFGAAIALTGQMYHLSGDFSAGILLWAGGALIATALTGSRGALAVALTTGCIWSGMRMFDGGDVPHVPFIAFWLIAVGLAVVWNSAVARHLVAIALGAWWTMTTLSYVSLFNWEPIQISAGGAALVFGAGLLLASIGPQSLRDLGATLTTYSAFSFVVVIALTIVGILDGHRQMLPPWVMVCAGVGLVLAFAAAAIGRKLAPALVGIALALGLLIAGGYTAVPRGQEQWLTYALALVAMLGLIVSGMLDSLRPRVVAGWLGMAVAIATITWVIEGSLLKRAVFLAIAGAVAVGLAIALGRFKPREVPA
jgi:uncharacterized membrane protein